MSANNSLNYPEAEIGSDHSLVRMRIEDIRLKQLKGGMPPFIALQQKIKYKHEQSY